MWIHRTESIVYNTSNISSLLSKNMEGREAPLPNFLIELSNSSMRTIRGERFKPREVSIFDLKIGDEDDQDMQLMIDEKLLQKEPIKIEPIVDNASIVAVDVSNIKIGETNDGVLCALRAATVWKSENSYLYLRCGPVVFHITDCGNHLLSHLGLKESISPSMFSSVTMRIMNRLRNTLERWTQRLVCSSSKDSIILFDGSLTAGTPDNPARRVQSVLELARESGSVVLAFSKSTKLSIGGRRVTDLLDHMSAPCLLDIDREIGEQFPSSPIKLLGRVYIAKLAVAGYTFRLDIDRQVPVEGAIETVSRLSGCDLVEQGYPETLRLAHILSTFTANEVIGIQRFIAKNYGLKIAPQPNLRRSLFGPFGTGREIT